MHELGVIKNLVSAAERLSKANGVSRLGYIKVDVGEFSGVVAQYMEKLWDIGTRDTICEGAELIINAIPGTVKCLECGEEYPLMESADQNDDKPRCPKCGSTRFDLVNDQSKGIFITELGAVE